MVPSSPKGPCNSGNTTSTSPRTLGGAPGSRTWSERSPVLSGTSTDAPEPSTSGIWPGDSSSEPESSDATTQRPSLAMPIGSTS